MCVFAREYAHVVAVVVCNGTPYIASTAKVAYIAHVAHTAPRALALDVQVQSSDLAAVSVAEYRAFQKRVALLSMLLVVSGTAVVYSAGGSVLAKFFFAGGVSGLLNFVLLARSVDAIDMAPASNG